MISVHNLRQSDYNSFPWHRNAPCKYNFAKAISELIPIVARHIEDNQDIEKKGLDVTEFSWTAPFKRLRFAQSFQELEPVRSQILSEDDVLLGRVIFVKDKQGGSLFVTRRSEEAEREEEREEERVELSDKHFVEVFLPRGMTFRTEGEVVLVECPVVTTRTQEPVVLNPRKPDPRFQVVD